MRNIKISTVTCGIILLTAVYQIRINLLHSQSPGPLLTLAPRGSFDLSVNPGAYIVDFFANSTGLYFTCRNDKAGEGQLLHTDDRGRVLNRIVLPPSSLHPSRIRADERGRIAVLQTRPSQSPELLFYENRSRTPRWIQLPSSPLDIQFVQGRLVAFTYDAVILVTSPDGQAVESRTLAQTDVNTPFLTACLPGDKVAIVSMPDATYRVVSLNGGISILPMLLTAPEIHRTTTTTAQSDTALVHTVAASEDGYIYSGLTGFKLKDGAVCAQFDQFGTFQKSIRFILPQFPELANNFVVKNGHRIGHELPYLYPAQLGISGHQFFGWTREQRK